MYVGIDARAQVPQQVIEQCAGSCFREQCANRFDSEPAYDQRGLLRTCERTCRASCAGSAVHRVLHPRFLILTVVYAPPGCSNGRTKCASASSVNYTAGSSAGTRISLGSSFKDGITSSVSAQVDVPGFSNFTASASGGFTVTTSDTQSKTVSNARSDLLTLKGGVDGIDHDQDQIFFLINPALTIDTAGNISQWDLGYNPAVPGAAAIPYNLSVAELKNPAVMAPAVAAQLRRLGFTQDDYDILLQADPFARGAGSIDAARYAPTGRTFPYKPALAAQCDNGSCNCPQQQHVISNSIQRDDTHAVSSEYTVGYGVEAKWQGLGFKNNGSVTFSNSSSITNSTASSNSATVSISCPSPDWNGPTNVAVYWDRLYGTFMFHAFILEPGLALLHQGRVMDDSGRPRAQQPVRLEYDGFHYVTSTDIDGNYAFYHPANMARTPGSAVLTVGKINRTITPYAPSTLHIELD